MIERVRVLVVDDEPAVVDTTSAILSEWFQVSMAANASEALELLKVQGVDVVCTDFNMPGKNGLELIKQARELWPALGAVLVTGYREYAARADKGGTGGYLLLVKPYEPEGLIELVRRAGEAALLKRRLGDLSAALSAEKRP